MLRTDHFLRPQRLGSAEPTARGVLARLGEEWLRLDVIRADIVRVKISRGGVFDESPTFAVCVDPLSEPAEFTLEEVHDRVLLRTTRLVVTLWRQPFRLDVHRTDGSAVVESVVDAEGRAWAYATLNDDFTLRRRCGPADAFFGLGEKSGAHNRRGRDFVLWNTDVLSPTETAEFTAGKAPDDPRGDRASVDFDPFYISIPFCYHQDAATGAMAASFIDNGYRGTYEFTASREYRVSFAGGQYTEYLFAGPEMADILEAYTWLTGRAALPPIWALGYHQCRWHIYRQEQVEALGRKHRIEGIPLDALWLDIEYMDGYRVFTWDADRFPDPELLLSRLAEQGIRVITIIDPGVKYEPGYRVFDEGHRRDLFCRTEGGDTYIGQVWPGNTAFPDFVSEEARAWWGELNAAHVRSGLAGIWNDMNEPATGEISPLRMRFGRGRFSHERYRNQYALLMAMGTRTGLLASMPSLRTFILSRSGFAGIQRYAANWMGDNLSRWDHLWVGIGMGCGLGVSGQPFVGADVGGFRGNADGELFLRWMQYAVLTPFCRNHTELGTTDQYAWSFGDEVQALVTELIRLRYRLLPYLYAAFVRATESGEPVQRPMVFDFQRDETVRDLDDQYLFGRDLLVAPVVAAGVTQRPVYLPRGAWYDWHSDEVAGQGRLVAAAPRDRIPVFARAGAVIPQWPEAPPSTAGYHPEVIELHVYLPREPGITESLLVEDDGLTFAAGRGELLRTTFALGLDGGIARLEASVSGKGFEKFRRRAFRLVLHGAAPQAIGVDRATIAREDGGYLVPNAGEPFSAEIPLA